MTLPLSKSIFIDGRKLGDGGIGTFIESLLEGICEYNPDSTVSWRIYLLVSESGIESCQEIIRGWEEKGVLVLKDNCPKYSLRELLILPLKWRRIIGQCEWYLSPHYVLPYFIPIKKAVVIHDVIHIQYPEKFRTRVVASFLIGSAVRRAEMIFAVSENSAEKLRKFIPAAGNREIKILPNSCSTDYAFRIREIPFQKEVRIIWVSADRVHKRLDFFIKFLAELKKTAVSFHADIVSRTGAGTRKLLQETGVEDNCTIHTNVSKSRLSELYNSADCFMTTSIDEGFCIPLLDAMRSGLPALCPDVAFARELGENAVWYYIPSSVESAVFQFSRMMTEPETGKACSEAGYQRSLGYSPYSTGRKLIESINNA
jgi:glycosyltransferase involved in cell wall biosynthesis